MPWPTYGAQRTTHSGQFSPSTMQVPGTELRSPDLAKSTFICRAILLTPGTSCLANQYFRVQGPVH